LKLRFVIPPPSGSTPSFRPGQTRAAISAGSMADPRPELRAPRADDAEPLAAILAEPEVARWWGRWDVDRVRRELLADAEGWTIEVDGEVAGWLQYEEESDPDYRRVSFDLFLTTPLHGRGHGRTALRAAIDHFAARGHHRFTIDPALANERAIRSYTAVGFRPVGVLREHERGPDGTWRDGLLMDLLVSDLRG
jgi:aminoglycoside 6'-N-acetyltransferase